ncbi:MAG: RnfH family protein [Pseudomonadota bacterium]
MDSLADEQISVEVALATPEQQVVIAVTVPKGSSAADAVQHSDIGTKFPELTLAKLKLGIWGEVVEPEHTLNSGDRVELYRPLYIDPRRARRELAAVGETMVSRQDEA